ncbi:hypothetical protein DMC30DRAFT_339544, partial [Rhodotorula diobovata]
MDRPHPLLDRLEAGTHSPPPLKSMCLQLLRHAWPAVADVGDAPYELLKHLLPLSTAPQLAQLEDASPQIAPYTNHIWRALAINEFIEVRKVIEDGQLSPEDEPESWRDQYEREEARREAKMEGLLSRMRGQLKEYKEGRKTIERVDAVLLARGRKTPAHSRPKTLMEKARSNTKAITSIYAPGRRKAASTARPAPSSASARAAFPSYRPRDATGSGSPPPPRPPPSSHPSQHTQQQPRPRPKPVIKTVTRVVSVPRARPAATPGSTSTPSSPPP